MLIDFDFELFIDSRLSATMGVETGRAHERGLTNSASSGRKIRCVWTNFVGFHTAIFLILILAVIVINFIMYAYTYI